MIKMTKEGYVFISKSGIRYELLEGMSFGQKERYTSDIIFILLADAEINVESYFVGYLYGAMYLENDLTGYNETISTMVDEFEKREGLING